MNRDIFSGNDFLYIVEKHFNENFKNIKKTILTLSKYKLNNGVKNKRQIENLTSRTLILHKKLSNVFTDLNNIIINKKVIAD